MAFAFEAVGRGLVLLTLEPSCRVSDIDAFKVGRDSWLCWLFDDVALRDSGAALPL